MKIRSPQQNEKMQTKLCRPSRSVCYFSVFSHENKDNLIIWFIKALSSWSSWRNSNKT